MEPVEYEVMARVEQCHWWYRALRDLLTRVLTTLDPPLPPRPRVLDAGCGTGANLQLLQELLAPTYLGGFDTSERALELSALGNPGADLYRSDIHDPEIRVSALDLVVSADVVSEAGAAWSRPGLRRLVDALAPGGRLVLHLPAMSWLFSEHDLAVHTIERYSRAEVGELLRDVGLHPELLTYRLFPLFPAFVTARTRRLRRPGSAVSTARSDLHREPGTASGRALLTVTRWENRLIARGWRLPWGSSVLAVGRKP